MYLVVINPVSDRGRTILRLPMLAKRFDMTGVDYEVHITTGKMDAHKKVKQFCTRYPDCEGIIGVGGDGIAQEIVAGMVDAFPKTLNSEKIPVPLGILPSPTGSDFYSSILGDKEAAQKKYKAETELIVNDFVDMIMKRNLRTIDVITANGMGFLNVGHVGMDAKLALAAASHKYKYDEYAYWVAGFQVIFKYESTHLKVDVNGKTHEEEHVLAAVCNGKYYGGGMCIAPSAKIDDGKITFCRITDMKKVKTFFAFVALLGEKHAKIKNLSYTECDEVKLTMPNTILCLDGNFYPTGGEVRFKILPSALEVFV